MAAELKQSPFKLLALDVDGTLLREGARDISPRVKEALLAASRIVRISFCTGRSHDDMLDIFDQLKLPSSYHILGGGAWLLTKTGEVQELAGVVDKGAALQQVMAMLGISQSEVMSVGDMTNDVPMFRVSGFSVAMGNAPLHVKMLSSAVTLAIEEDGLALAIEKHILSLPCSL